MKSVKTGFAKLDVAVILSVLPTKPASTINVKVSTYTDIDKMVSDYYNLLFIGYFNY